MVVHLIDAEGVNRQVLLLSGALRPAVINFVLTEKYGKDPDLAASIVVLNTLLSILSIPLLFWMIV
jgi:malate permease and related proteins